MKVSIRHGHGIPTPDQILVPYGFGYDESDRKYGEGKGGKTLYIKDPETGKVVEITGGLLKKEFLNYVFPVKTIDGKSEGAQIDFDEGQYEYAESEDPNFFGLVAGLVYDKEDIIDENGDTIGQRVYVDHTAIDTRINKFKRSASGVEGDTVKTLVFNSVDPKYIAKLKNSIEQKALYTVNDRSELEALVDRLNIEKKLEDGVQILVKHDDSILDTDEVNPDDFVVSDDDDPSEDANPTSVNIVNNENTNLDTWLYVVSRVDSDISEGRFDERTIQVSNELGEFVVTALMPLEYKYHDAVFETNRGLLIVQTANDEINNTRTYKIDDDTTDTVIKAYTDASYLDITRTTEGHVADALKIVNADDGITADMEAAGLTNEKAFAEGRRFNDVVTFTEKTYSFINGRVVKGTKKSCIDFSDFVLDEGSWD